MSNQYRRIKNATAIQYTGEEESISAIYDWIRTVYGKGNSYQPMPYQMYETVHFFGKGDTTKWLIIQFYENWEPDELRINDWLVNQNNSCFQTNRFQVVSNYDFKNDYELVDETENESKE